VFIRFVGRPAVLSRQSTWVDYSPETAFLSLLDERGVDVSGE